MKTIVYKNGSDYIGEYEDKKLAKWKQLGINLNQYWMYKGYRYWNNQRDTVIVYDTEPWDAEEINRRRNNGFLGIKEYHLQEAK